MNYDSDEDYTNMSNFNFYETGIFRETSYAYDDNLEDELFEALYDKNINECINLIQTGQNTLNFNKRDEIGNTYLLTACKKLMENVAIMIVNTNKCNLYLTGSNNMTVLEMAYRSKLNNLVKLLVGTDAGLLNMIDNNLLLSILQNNKSVLINKITNDRVAHLAMANNLDILVENKQKFKQNLLKNDLMLEAIIENSAENLILELNKIKLSNKNKECIVCSTVTDTKFIFDICHHVYCLDISCSGKINKCPICRTVSTKTRCYFVEE